MFSKLFYTLKERFWGWVSDILRCRRTEGRNDSSSAYGAFVFCWSLPETFHRTCGRALLNFRPLHLTLNKISQLKDDNFIIPIPGVTNLHFLPAFAHKLTDNAAKGHKPNGFSVHGYNSVFDL